jgi:hypothetical protein
VGHRGSVCVVEWSAESASQLTEQVIAVVPTMRAATHDRTDPSYDRPLAASRPDY